MEETLYPWLHKPLFPPAAPETSLPPPGTPPAFLPETRSPLGPDPNFYEPVRTLKEAGLEEAGLEGCLGNAGEGHPGQEDSCQGDQVSGRGPKPWLACIRMRKDLKVQISPRSFSVKAAGHPLGNRV